MIDFKNTLRVRSLNNEKVQIPVREDFRDQWIAEFLPIEWVISENGFGEKGFFLDGECYQYKLASEFPAICDQNKRGKSHPLLKCFQKFSGQHILDLSCGEGRDALTLLIAGFQVSAYERVPEIAVFFLINLKSLFAVMPLPLDKFEYVVGNWMQDKESLKLGNHFYYDPMYAPTKRKSLPRGTIQLFESLAKDVDQNDNGLWLFENVLGRIVIKRSPKASELMPKKTYEVSSKLVRYDVYERN